MADDEVFSLAANADVAREAAEVLFAVVAVELVSVLPGSAEVLHVGATAVPGCLTKGDLDIVVRVDRVDFAFSEALLAKRFSRNEGSIRTDEFAAFEDPDRCPNLGVVAIELNQFRTTTRYNRAANRPSGEFKPSC